MRKKRFLAVALTTSMILGSSVAAFGSSFPTTNITNPENASGTISGQMTFEGTVSEDVFSVDLPTVSWNANVFDFILDPQELIKKTDGLRYDKNSGLTANTPAATKQITNAGQNIEWSTLYFVNYVSDNSGAASANKLSASSDALTIVNKSAIDVDVSLTATVSGMDSLEVVSNNTNMSANADPSIYLALQGSASSNVANVEDKEAINKDGGASIATQISGNDGAYITSINATTGKYEKVLSANSTGFKEYSFSLTGACGGGDVKAWQAKEDVLKAASPYVSVTWKVTPHSDDVGPSVAQSRYEFNAGQPAFVTVDFGSGALAATQITAIEFVNRQGNTVRLEQTYYDITGNQIKFKVSATDLITTSKEYTIVFDNGAKEKVTLARKS